MYHNRGAKAVEVSRNREQCANRCARLEICRLSPRLRPARRQQAKLNEGPLDGKRPRRGCADLRNVEAAARTSCAGAIARGIRPLYAGAVGAGHADDRWGKSPFRVSRCARQRRQAGRGVQRLEPAEQCDPDGSFDRDRLLLAHPYRSGSRATRIQVHRRWRMETRSAVPQSHRQRNRRTEFLLRGRRIS